MSNDGQLEYKPIPSLRRLATLPFDAVRINLMTRQRQELLNIRLQGVGSMIRELSGRGIRGEAFVSLEPLASDIVDALNIGGATRDVSDAGTSLLAQIDRLWNALVALASASGFQIILETDGRTRLLETAPATLRELESIQARLNHLEAVVSVDLVGEIQASLKEVDQGRQAMARMLAEAGKDAAVIKVGDYNDIFRKAAAKHRAQAKRWLFATAGLAVLSLSTAATMAGLAYSNLDPTSEIGASLGKSAVILILVSATVWSGLNYRSHQHNAVVNEHRGDSLGSYDAFSAAASTKEAKDTILLQATAAIYAAQPSGFVSHDGEANTAGVGLLGAVLATKGAK